MVCPWRRLGRILATVLVVGLAERPALAAEPPRAFPGAEGFGRLAQGGRGGDVYHVTTLNDDGPGSLRDGLRTARGPRTIVFTLSGTIELRCPLTIDRSYLTLAGQTAPGEGITLRDYSVRIRQATDVVIRYLRFRLGDEHKPPGAKGADDTLVTDDVDRVILDHCSLSWAVDGTHDLRRGGNFTLQWCLISEALNHSLHSKGAHAMGASYRDLSGPITLHHNLFATCRDRHPTLGSAKSPPQYLVDFRNNLIYNWTSPGTTNFCDHFILGVNNLWLPGPESDLARLPIAMKGSLPDLARGYLEGNVFEDRPDLTADNYAALDFARWLQPRGKYAYRGTRTTWPVAAPPDLGSARPPTQDARRAAGLVLEHAGASHRRDAVDRRVIDDVRHRRGRLIDSQREVGGWPTLASEPPPRDSDLDGMPDDWETRQGLNPSDPSDRNLPAAEGFTQLENYLNGLVAPPPTE